ncbi:hypothetical protein GFH48_26725 [Streptomyces fagopyri]|uniref:Uncharacterized protein n=1 Tax=Streptomyces fagopyri TaxID=2662397 RepID=A0A5Q0LH74_9ACTN|nr:hypothetical protein [Streptomyces fagopyri]QFZ76383.1 hypothetical protein GFH48_26725 [Streptomyces fagopyri]
MAAIQVVIEVDQLEVSDLELLRAEIAQDAPLMESRALDGDTVVQAVTTLTAATIPIFYQWLSSRVDRNQRTVISRDGERIEQLTRADLEQLIRDLQGEIDDPPDATGNQDGTE